MTHKAILFTTTVSLILGTSCLSTARQEYATEMKLKPHYFPHQHCVLGQITHVDIRNSNFNISLLVQDVLQGDFSSGQRLTLHFESPPPGFLPKRKLIGASCVWAFNAVRNKRIQNNHTHMSIFNLYSPFPDQVFTENQVNSLKRTLTSIPQFDNCIRCRVLKFYGGTPSRIVVKVEEVLLGAFGRGQVLVLSTNTIPRTVIPKGQKTLTVGRSCFLSFTECEGWRNLEQNASINEVTKGPLPIANLSTPFPHQVFSDFDVLRLKRELEVNDLLSTTFQHIEQRWSLPKIKDFCRLESRGLSEEEIIKPSEDEQFLYVSPKYSLIHAKAERDIGKVTWVAIIRKGKVLAIRIFIDKGKDHWRPAIFVLSKTPPKADDFVIDRLANSLRNSLRSYSLVNRVDNSWWSRVACLNPHMQYLHRDKQGNIKAFIQLGTDGKTLTAMLDSTLSITKILINDKPDRLWNQMHDEAPENYERRNDI